MPLANRPNQISTPTIPTFSSKIIEIHFRHRPPSTNNQPYSHLIVSYRLHHHKHTNHTPHFAKMGKVHGSLARAGKVKSQTPKVEKTEKPKTPKGRAKKRLTYTRRFVNVTLTGGKRKMNPNPTT
ncbi:ribosomal protein S30-domain-containing protein [Xylariales sp. AK1849]|nr:ribosomal protein S30-domain-containing protein [Xylariales sp. AK1849]